MGNQQTSIEKKSFFHNINLVSSTYISEAKLIGENTVKLTFNKEIAKEVLNMVNTNYSLSYLEDDNTIVKTPLYANYIDEKTIILKFDNIDMNMENKITFKIIIDYGNHMTINQTEHITLLTIGD